MKKGWCGHHTLKYEVTWYKICSLLIKRKLNEHISNYSTFLSCFSYFCCWTLYFSIWFQVFAESGKFLTENVELDADVDERDIDPETGQILPDKYNYLKIENVFSGQLMDVDALFSLELALLTKQPSVSSDLLQRYLKSRRRL